MDMVNWAAIWVREFLPFSSGPAYSKWMRILDSRWFSFEWQLLSIEFKADWNLIIIFYQATNMIIMILALELQLQLQLQFHSQFQYKFLKYRISCGSCSRHCQKWALEEHERAWHSLDSCSLRSITFRRMPFSFVVFVVLFYHTQSMRKTHIVPLPR